MTRDEETAERNACDEWWHEKGGASIQDAWVERARRAKATPIYQRQLSGGEWIDTSKLGYDGWYKDRRRIVYADQSSVPSKEGEA